MNYPKLYCLVQDVPYLLGLICDGKEGRINMEKRHSRDCRRSACSDS